MTIPVDIILEENSSQIKHNLRVETSREKFSSSNKLDKVENHKTRSNINNENCAQSKLRVQVGILVKDHPSQMKINPTSTPQVNKPEKKILSAVNLNYLDNPRSNSKDDRKIPGIDPHPFKIKNTPGYNKFLQVNIEENIKAPRRRLEKDDNNSSQTTCKLEETVEIGDTPTRIFEQLSKIQSGSVKITQAVKMTESGSMMKSLSHTKSKINLRPGRRKDLGKDEK